MLKLSVIMPVYNVKEFLAEAIESVISQQYKNWELLLIENGSEDGSGEICADYAEKYEKIRVLHGEKSGPGDARNQGMQKARGEYLMFMDADDFLPNQSVMNRLLKLAEDTEADIAIGNYERLWNGQRLQAKKNSCYACLPSDSMDFRFQGFFSVGSLSYVWGRIYRAEFLKKHEIQFSDYKYAEDKMFNICCYLEHARYAFMDGLTYVYRKNENSISYQYKTESKECWLRMAGDVKEKLEEKKILEEKKDLMQDLIFFAVFFDAKMEYEEKKKSRHAIRRVLKGYEKDALGKEIFHELAFGKGNSSPSQLLWKIMIRGFSIGMSLHLYFLLSLGIKLLIEFQMDERLSDTGKRG